MFLWIAFGLGILLQAFSSHLEISNNAFVMSPAWVKTHADLDPIGVVNRERKLQALSGLLVLGGAIGLAVFYRRALVESLTGAKKEAGR